MLDWNLGLLKQWTSLQMKLLFGIQIQLSSPVIKWPLRHHDCLRVDSPEASLRATQQKNSHQTSDGNQWAKGPTTRTKKASPQDNLRSEHVQRTIHIATEDKGQPKNSTGMPNSTPGNGSVQQIPIKSSK